MFNKTFFAALVTWTLLAGACGRHDDSWTSDRQGSPGESFQSPALRGARRVFVAQAGNAD